MSPFKDGTCNHVLKELEQSKHSSSTKSAAANKLTTKIQKAVLNVVITDKKQSQVRNIIST